MKLTALFFWEANHVHPDTGSIPGDGQKLKHDPGIQGDNGRHGNAHIGIPEDRYGGTVFFTRER